MGSEKSKILIIGGTGYIGKFIVAASARSGHPTFSLVRSTTVPADQPAKAKLLSDFQAAGVTLIQVKLTPFSHCALALFLYLFLQCAMRAWSCCLIDRGICMTTRVWLRRSSRWMW
ncbi:unnamed protein product [Musa hybrid cultivar]